MPKNVRSKRTLVIAATKGGCGKSSLAVHLAVLASRSTRTVLVDTDPQGSAVAWWRRRQSDSPHLVEASVLQLPTVQSQAREQGLSLLVVDTAPRCDVKALTQMASFVLIPCRPSPFDLDAIGEVVELVSLSRTPAAIVLNACPPGRGAREASVVKEAREALAGGPIPVAPMSIGQRSSLSHALITGQAVTEFEPEGKAAAEIQSLWKWIKGRMQ